MTQRNHFRAPQMQTCTSFVEEERGNCYEIFTKFVLAGR